jgi:hypothetical protein
LAAGGLPSRACHQAIILEQLILHDETGMFAGLT